MPQERPAFRGDRDPRALAVDQPVRLQRREARAGIGERLFRHAVAGGEAAGIDAQIAEQALDDRAAQPVFGVEGDAAGGGEALGLERRDIVLGRQVALGIAGRDLRNRAGAEADQQIGAVGCVARKLRQSVPDAGARLIASSSRAKWSRPILA